jgi:hypothetical protein
MTINEKITKLLETSILFTAEQKEAWLNLLPKMNFEELTELQGILVDEVKELKKEGINLVIDPKFEVELIETGHGASLSALKAVAGSEKVPMTSNSFATELKREVVTKELAGDVKKIIPPIPPKPPVPMPVIRNDVIAPKLVVKQARPISNLKSIHDVRTVDDLRKIQVAHLRQGDLISQLVMIKTKIMDLIKVNKVLPFYVVAAFEDSPLFQTYLTIGANLISDDNPDRKVAYQRAVEQSVKSGQDVLGIEEFEAIADLRKDIEQL